MCVTQFVSPTLVLHGKPSQTNKNKLIEFAFECIPRKLKKHDSYGAVCCNEHLRRSGSWPAQRSVSLSLSIPLPSRLYLRERPSPIRNKCTENKNPPVQCTEGSLVRSVAQPRLVRGKGEPGIRCNKFKRSKRIIDGVENGGRTNKNYTFCHLWAVAGRCLL